MTTANDTNKADNEHSHPHSHGDDHHDHHDDDHGGMGHGAQTFFHKYVFSTDHKIIGMQFMFTALMFVVIGGALALGVRYELAWPKQNVPHLAVLPGKMTAQAPEGNVALWQIGGEVVFNSEVKQDKVNIPANAKGTIIAMPRLAVIIPIGTRVEGNAHGLGDHVGAPSEDEKAQTQTVYVNRNDVIADYNYNYQFDYLDGNGSQKMPSVLAPSGTPVYTSPTPATDGSEEPSYILDSANLHLQVFADPIQLPSLAPQTDVTIHVPAQVVGEGDKAVKVKEATVTIKASTALVRFDKQSLTPDAYGSLFTMHATIMVFFALMPMLIGAFGNFLIPLMIGARDMAFPKLNMLSYWLAIPASIIMMSTFWVEGGPAAGGWTMYPPLSERGFVQSDLGTTLWAVSIFLIGFSSIVGSLNYITTIINMRAPGMTMLRMPLTVWSLFITAILLLLATPVLAAAGILLALDRTLDTQFFQDTILLSDGSRVAAGGQPLLWQHLFWFFGHPEVYILILPAMGITSDILVNFSRKPIFGYKPMVYAMCAIAGLGFIVWGHHMFQSGMNPILGTTFMASTIMIAVPSAIKTFNWLGTLWGGNIKFTVPMCWAIGFVAMFAVGGLSGIFMAAAPVDIHIHDTYFIVAHIHYVLFGGTIMAIFGGIYYWFPKMFGRAMNERWGYIHFFLTMIGLNGTFFMMHVLGVGGHPRRYASIMEYPTLTHLQGMNVLMSIFALMLGMAQLPFFYNFFVSLPRKVGRAASAAVGIAWLLPMVIGLSWWAAEEGMATWGWLTELIAHQPTITTGEGEAVTNVTGEWQFSSIAQIAGIVSLVGVMAYSTLLMWLQLPGKKGDIVIAGIFVAFLMVAVNVSAITCIVLALVASPLIIAGYMRSARFSAVSIMVILIYVVTSISSSGNGLNKQGQFDFTLDNREKLVDEVTASSAAAFATVDSAVAQAAPDKKQAVLASETLTAKTKLAAEIATSIDRQWKAQDQIKLRDDHKSAIATIITETSLGEVHDETHAGHSPAHGSGAGDLAGSIINQFAAYKDQSDANWTKVKYDLTVATGIGVLFSLIVIGIIWLVWFVGGMIKMPAILQRLLYIIALPAFLAPLLLKPDSYMWIGNVSLFEMRWLFMALAALPGAAYLLLRRPNDQFGHDVGTNPWQANSLEWVATDSPPLAHGNFHDIPTVHRGPYEYSSPVVEEDWLPQTTVLPEGVVEPEAH